MKRKYFTNGMTVAQLKEFIKDWPETSESGEPNEVWLEDAEGNTHPVTSIWPIARANNSLNLLISLEE